MPAAALLVALAGCTADAVSAEPPEATAPAGEPTPTPTPTPAVVPRPDLMFGGDCRTLFDEASVAALTGGSVSTRPTRVEHDFAVETLGGLSCGWTDTADVATLRVTVLPVSALGP